MHYLFLLPVLLFACRTPSDKVFDEPQTIELVHLPWACDSSKFLLPTAFNITSYNELNCARWTFPNDVSKYVDKSNDSLKYFSIFIEPEDSSVNIPNIIEFFNDGVKLTGQFYKKKGFPLGHQPLHPSDSAKVFRYKKFEILRNKYRDLIKTN